MKRYALVAVLAVALGLGTAGAADANRTWLQTVRGMERNLMAYGIDFRGQHEDVWAARCWGRGHSEWQNGRRWWAYFRCHVGIYGDAFAAMRVWPTGPDGWQYRSRFLEWV